MMNLKVWQVLLMFTLLTLPIYMLYEVPLSSAHETESETPPETETETETESEDETETETETESETPPETEKEKEPESETPTGTPGLPLMPRQTSKPKPPSGNRGLTYGFNGGSGTCLTLPGCFYNYNFLDVRLGLRWDSFRFNMYTSQKWGSDGSRQSTFGIDGFIPFGN